MSRLIVIDGNAIVHRAFHAIPPLTSRNKGQVNAVYGFLLFFLRSIKEFQPDFIAAAFDLQEPTFRHIEYKEYKAKREKAPQELYDQIPLIKEMLSVFNVPVFEKKGYEADDVIGTIARLSPVETIILSGDMDSLQLVDKKTKLYALKRGVKDSVLYDIEKVKERYEGLTPEQMVDYRALKGDPSDNIPGVKGIGEKTAISLLKEFHTLDGIYNNLEKIKPTIKEKLKLNKENALFSKKLSRIEVKVPIDFDIKQCLWARYEKKKVEDILKEFGFTSLLSKIPEPCFSCQEKEVKNNLSLW